MNGLHDWLIHAAEVFEGSGLSAREDIMCPIMTVDSWNLTFGPDRPFIPGSPGFPRGP